ncbi:MAG: hypothetical protein DIU79_16250 [Actinobacteria bacterium]|nr:MAG: hypothetical protein DIU79_16250 [Actinomycetota bacterium]
MSEPLTLERLAELRRIAEAAVPGKWSGQDFQLAMTPRTVLALLDEIERLRRERETLAAAVMAWEEYRNAALGSIAEVEAVAKLREAHTKALAQLQGRGEEGQE